MIRTRNLYDNKTRSNRRKRRCESPRIEKDLSADTLNAMEDTLSRNEC